MKTQICTSIEQSKKLLELGLNPKSADMTYCAITEGMREKMIIKDWQANIGLDIAIKENLFSYRNGYIVPCWSLAALFGVLPKQIEIADNVYPLSIYLTGLYYWNYNNGNLLLEVKDKDNLVDACVEMIEKLHELKIL